MPTSRQLPTGRRLPRFERVVLRLARVIRRTARVHPLDLGDFLVVNRDRRAAVALFTDEVVTGGGDVTAQARHALEIDHLVPADLDPRGRRRRVGRQGGGQLQGEELPPVCLGKLCLGMLHMASKATRASNRSRASLASGGGRPGGFVAVTVLLSLLKDT